MPIKLDEISKKHYFMHPGLGEVVFTKNATAQLIGCTLSNLLKIRGKNGLNPLKSRWHRATVYAQSDIEAYLARREVN
ncbi:hypothetical protein [Candidatus Avelusimicrobium alvi]|uniref:hypothetical protein n=1 Tax=Candidatus Avelusimicrobium alvi TaxID=3416221 RepID=UPI003D14C353